MNAGTHRHILLVCLKSIFIILDIFQMNACFKSILPRLLLVKKGYLNQNCNLVSVIFSSLAVIMAITNYHVF